MIVKTKTAKRGGRKTLAVLDAHAIIHRAYHALPDFHNSKGEPTGALYGVVLMLVSLVKDIHPDYIVACFDVPKPTFRHNLYKTYKKGRKKAEKDLIDQIKKSKELFNVFNIPVYEAPGYEADDVIGSIVKIVAKNGAKKKFGDLRVVIASGDADTMQLVKGEDVVVYTPKKGVKEMKLYDERAVIEKFGFAPELLVDYKALRGDPSDNIPGVAGVGDKTAVNLINRFGNLDKIYANLEKIKNETDKNAIKKNTGLTPRILHILLNQKEEAYFSKILATINTNTPINFKMPDNPWIGALNCKDALKFVSDLEFRTLIPVLEEVFKCDKNIKSQTSTSYELNEKDIDKTELLYAKVALWLIKSDFTDPSFEDIIRFTNARAEGLTWHEIMDTLFDVLEKRNLMKVFNLIEKPLVEIVEKINNAGVLLDIKYFENLSKRFHLELENKKMRIFELAGEEFNIRSPKQLGEILFDKLKLKKGSKTATGQYATNEKELRKLKGLHPIVDLIFEYRELHKLLSTYVDTLPKMRDKDGRLRTCFIQTGTSTGRMASKNPNLQNIPVKTHYGELVRKGFVAPKGKELISFDYSQIELRVVALLSGDKKMISVFRSGGDIHTSVASEVFGVKPEHVTKEMRRRAKVINFGILYGMGVNALRANLQDGTNGGEVISVKDARSYLNRYFQSYKGLAEWVNKTKNDACRLGYTQTLFGRRRYFEGLQSDIPYIRASAERMAINAPVQGTAADIIKLAMIYANKILEKYKNAFMILQIHDEIICEVEEKDVCNVAKEIKNEMEKVLETPDIMYKTSNVPLKVDVKSGKNWLEMRNLD